MKTIDAFVRARAIRSRFRREAGTMKNCLKRDEYEGVGGGESINEMGNFVRFSSSVVYAMMLWKKKTLMILSA